MNRRERAARSDPENGAQIIASAEHGGSIKIAVIRLDQGSFGVSAIVADEYMQRSQNTLSGNFKNRTATQAAVTTAAVERCSVETPIGTLNERRVGIGTVSIVKVVQYGQHALRSNLKNCAVPVCSIQHRSAVKIPVGSEKKSCCRTPTVGAIRLRAEVV